MHTAQTSLGQPIPYPYPRFDHVAMAKVTGTVDYATIGRVEVQFINDGGLAGGMAVPAYVVESGLSVGPEEGDTVLVGFIRGDKNSPWLIGTFMGGAATSGLLRLKKDRFTVSVKTDLGSIVDLEAYVAALYSQVVDLNGHITTLNEQITTLNEQIAALILEDTAIKARLTALESR